MGPAGHAASCTGLRAAPPHPQRPRWQRAGRPRRSTKGVVTEGGGVHRTRSRPCDQKVRTLPDALTMPLPAECVLCFVWRMLGMSECNVTLRWARVWRAARAPRATSLERRLGRRGAFCDCQIFLNAWVTAASLVTGVDHGRARGSPTPGLCLGVRGGSSQPCALWVPKPRPLTPAEAFPRSSLFGSGTIDPWRT